MPLTPVDPTEPSGPVNPADPPSPAPTNVTTPLPAGGNVIGIIQITDSSQVRIATVKAGATAAVGGDQSLVVALSPNTPIPPGANVIGQVSLSAALPSGNNNIGDVDIVTMPNVTLAAGQLPAALAAGGGLKVEGVVGGVAVPVSMASAPLPAGGATEATLATRLATADLSIKAAATPAAAGDKALVVAQSPNTPLPPGANAIGSVSINAALPTGDNRVGRIKVTDDTNVAKVAVAAPLATDPGLVVHIASQPPGGAAGTQYTEGDIDASVTGNAVMWKDTADTMRVASASKPLPVDIKKNLYAAGDDLTAVIPSNLHLLAYLDTLNIVRAATELDPLPVRLLDGLPASPAEIGKVQISDGVSVASVMAASTAPVAADKALVVAVSPNSPFPQPPSRTTPAPTGVVVSLVSVTVLAANVNRRGVIICNVSPNLVSFDFGAGTAVVGEGITLQPGERWIMDNSTFVTAGINAIASGPGSRVTVQEFAA